MSRKEAGKHIFFKRTKIALILSLSFVCLMVPRQAARAQYNDNDVGNAISPYEAEQAFGQDWREVLQRYKAADEKFRKEQQGRLNDSKRILFYAQKKNKLFAMMQDDPSLEPDLGVAFATQKDAENYLQEHPNSGVDPSLHVYIGKSEDTANNENLVFVEMRGSFFCSAHGCPITIYVGRKGQYRAAMHYIGDNNINVSRKDGKIYLFFDPQAQIKPVEWVLQGDTFVKNSPPPSASQAPEYLQWKHEQELKKAQELKQEKKNPAPSPGGETPSEPGLSNDTIIP